MKKCIKDLLKYHNTLIDPIQFMIKEMTKWKEYDFKSNIYMLGLIYSIIAGILPEVKIERYKNDNFFIKNYLAIIPDSYSEEVKHFIQKLLTVNKDEKPSAQKTFTLVISYYIVK